MLATQLSASARGGGHGGWVVGLVMQLLLFAIDR